MVQCFLFPGGNRVVARYSRPLRISMPYYMCRTWVSQSPRNICKFSLDPTMRSVSSSNHRNCFRPPTAIVPTRTYNGLLQENVENGWRQVATSCPR